MKTTISQWNINYSEINVYCYVYVVVVYAYKSCTLTR